VIDYVEGETRVRVSMSGQESCTIKRSGKNI